jgi:hypothetical protein
MEISPGPIPQQMGSLALFPRAKHGYREKRTVGGCLASNRMLEALCEGCHSDPEQSEREESPSGNKGLARFLPRDCGIELTD